MPVAAVSEAVQGRGAAPGSCRRRAGGSRFLVDPLDSRQQAGDLERAERPLGREASLGGVYFELVVLRLAAYAMRCERLDNALRGRVQ